MFSRSDSVPSRLLCGVETLLVLACSTGCSGGVDSISGPVGSSSSRTAFYVDCSQATDGSGLQSSPWNSLSDANAHTFVAGNSLLFKRGTTCSGALQPSGSGEVGSPIVVDAYGIGNLPVLNGGSSSQQVILLYNQSYWEINDLEIVGGLKYGVHVGGNIANDPLYHIYLRNLNVHDATGTSVLRGDSGEVLLGASGAGQTLNDILVDGVTASNSQVSEGILVNAGGAWAGGNPQPLGNNVTIQNSTVHDVFGDGILIMELTNGTIQNSVVYRSGLCPNCASTPSGLWEWYCHTCTIQNNESYANQTWNTHDGGDFDIDYYNNDNIVQYNYGHDSAGYCIAFFGSENAVDIHNIFRYNVCSNNAQSASNAYQGDVFLSTWNGGSLSGVEIYNNTFYWNPAAPAPLLNTMMASYTGSAPTFFENNIVYSTVPDLVATTSAFTLDYNIYWTTATTSPQWAWNGVSHTSLAAFQARSAQDEHSLFVNPLLNNPTSHSPGILSASAFTLETGSPAIGAGTNVCAGINECFMGSTDFFGNPLPVNGSGYNIGAYQ